MIMDIKPARGRMKESMCQSEILRLTAASHRAENLFPGQVNSYERQKKWLVVNKVSEQLPCRRELKSPGKGAYSDELHQERPLPRHLTLPHKEDDSRRHQQHHDNFLDCFHDSYLLLVNNDFF